MKKLSITRRSIKMSVNLEDFIGDGSSNEDGLALTAFLDAYNPSDYKNPSITTDTLIFSYKEDYRGIDGDNLKLLMIRRKNHPCIGWWALPGGFVNIDEDMEAAAKRELLEETGVRDVNLMQLYTWGNANRDPRTRIITTTYMAVIEESIVTVCPGDDAQDAAWFTVKVQELEVTDRNKLRSFQIQLMEPIRDIMLACTINVMITDDGIIKKKDYIIQERQGISFDHPKAIMQALDVLVLKI